MSPTLYYLDEGKCLRWERRTYKDSQGDCLISFCKQNSQEVKLPTVTFKHDTMPILLLKEIGKSSLATKYDSSIHLWHFLLKNAYTHHVHAFVINAKSGSFLITYFVRDCLKDFRSKFIEKNIIWIRKIQRKKV